MFIFLYIIFFIFTYVYVYLHIFCVFLYIFLHFLHIKLLSESAGDGMVERLPRKAILSRVGDRPTATILHAQFHLFDFCMVFEGKTFTKICPS